MNTPLALFGFASGIASNNVDCGLGPWSIWYHPEWFIKHQLHVEWQPMIQTSDVVRGQAAWLAAEQNITQLAHAILPFAQNDRPFCVIGGDHSCAIGTWSAVAHANRARGDIGLIWIDAHMDSHTPTSSHTKNIHGMPLAHLLGHGLPTLCHLLDTSPKLKPEHICLIGIRSYEEEELALLNELGVTIYFMSDVQERGIEVILPEAYKRVSQTTCGVGITIDLDAIDPHDAPGVGCREPNGIVASELIQSLHALCINHALLGLEITEYNPIRDQDHATAAILLDLIHAVYGT